MSKNMQVPCQGILPDWCIFSIPFLLWQKDSSGWARSISFLWLVMALPRESHSREIPSKNKPFYDNAVNGIWVELNAPTHRLPPIAITLSIQVNVLPFESKIASLSRSRGMKSNQTDFRLQILSSKNNGNWKKVWVCRPHFKWPAKITQFNYLFQIPQNEESNKGHFEDHLFKKGKNVFDLKNIREWGRNIYIYI